MAVWLVTGATSGFGAAIARRAVKDGHRVVAAGRRVARLEALRDELGADKCHIVDLDVRDRASTEALVKGLPPSFADVDVLVSGGVVGGRVPRCDASALAGAVMRVGCSSAAVTSSPLYLLCFATVTATSTPLPLLSSPPLLSPRPLPLLQSPPLPPLSPTTASAAAPPR